MWRFDQFVNSTKNTWILDPQKQFHNGKQYFLSSMEPKPQVKTLKPGRKKNSHLLILRERVDAGNRRRSRVHRSHSRNLDGWHRYLDRRRRRGNVGLRVLRNSGHWIRLLKVEGQRKIGSVWVGELRGWRRRRWSGGWSHG